MSDVDAPSAATRRRSRRRPARSCGDRSGGATARASEQFFAWKHARTRSARRRRGSRSTATTHRRAPHPHALGVRRAATATCGRCGPSTPRPTPTTRAAASSPGSRCTRIEELARDGVDFVFNTPNDQSRPGYLKMGWQVVGRLPGTVRPLSRPGARAHRPGARVPAERWSARATAGDPAAAVLADATRWRRAARVAAPALRHCARAVTPAYLAWRYGGDLLRVPRRRRRRRALEGVAIFRVRARGAAREARAVRGPDRGWRRRASAASSSAGCVRAADADYLIRRSRAASVAPGGLLPLPGQGPMLTWRTVATLRSDPPADWDLEPRRHRAVLIHDELIL